MLKTEKEIRDEMEKLEEKALNPVLGYGFLDGWLHQRNYGKIESLKWILNEL